MENKFQLTRQENIFLAKRNIIDSIYRESRLEGIALTFPETAEIYEGRNVAGLTVDEVVKVNNLKHAWNFILDTADYPIDIRYIRQLNQIIGGNIVPLAGELRSSDVTIGGTNWRPEIPDYDSVERNIENIMDSTESETDKAISLMLYLMRGQLFYDGNKRVAQLAANQVMIQNGAGIISIPIERQKEFLSMLVQFYETNRMERLKKFIYETSVAGLVLPKRAPQEAVSEEEFYR